MREYGKENFTFVILCKFTCRKQALEFEATCIQNAYTDGRALNKLLPNGRTLGSATAMREGGTPAAEKRRQAERKDYWRRVRAGLVQPPLDWVNGRIVPLSTTGIDQLG